MNNGLRGRYEPGLEMWNRARSLAAELIAAGFDNNRSISAVIEAHRDVGYPSISEIKATINRVLFHSGRSRIDTLAREIMKWDGWSVPFGSNAMTGASA